VTNWIGNGAVMAVTASAARSGAGTPGEPGVAGDLRAEDLSPRKIVKESLPDQRPYSRGRHIHGNHYTQLSETTTGVPS
jgi:hypothetical protein